MCVHTRLQDFFTGDRLKIGKGSFTALFIAMSALPRAQKLS
jgi:hypothetical protein